ncbi:hypothetical protein ACTXT7_007819 [Hymenolepis weldensis]
MEVNWPPRGREKSIVNAQLIHSERLSLWVCEKSAWDGMIDENHGKSMHDMLPKIFTRGQLMSTKTTQENRLTGVKGLLNKLKHPEEEKWLWFFSDQKASTGMKKSSEEIICGYVGADLTEVPTVIHAHETAWPMEEDLMTFNKTRLHPVRLSKPKIGWMAEDFRYHATHVEKEVNKHPHTTRSSSLMEAIARGMENTNKDYLLKA